MVWKVPGWYNIKYNFKSILFCYAFNAEISKNLCKRILLNVIWNLHL